MQSLSELVSKEYRMCDIQQFTRDMLLGGYFKLKKGMNRYDEANKGLSEVISVVTGKATDEYIYSTIDNYLTKNANATTKETEIALDNNRKKFVVSFMRGLSLYHPHVYSRIANYFDKTLKTELESFERIIDMAFSSSMTAGERIKLKKLTPTYGNSKQDNQAQDKPTSSAVLMMSRDEALNQLAQTAQFITTNNVNIPFGNKRHYATLKYTEMTTAALGYAETIYSIAKKQ